MTDCSDTKSRLLDVAEELFGENGIERVSVRDITEAAKANLAAINYHFGSKEELVEAVFTRRVAPVNEARLTALDEVEARSQGGAAPNVEDILDAFIRPAVTACRRAGKEGSSGGTAFAKLFGRCLTEPGPEVEALLTRQFSAVSTRFEQAFSRALPDLTRSEIFWKFKFTFGALHHFLLTKDKFVPKWVEASDPESQLRKLVGFAAAGFRAR